LAAHLAVIGQDQNKLIADDRYAHRHVPLFPGTSGEHDRRPDEYQASHRSCERT